MIKKEIDHEGTDEIVCPHCGHIHEDSWEMQMDSSPHTSPDGCYNCELLFDVKRYVNITYSTKKVSSEELKIRKIKYQEQRKQEKY